MVREINQALRKRIPPSWVNLTTKSFGYIWLKSEKCPKITNSYIKSNIFAQSSLVIGPNMIWKSQTKPKTNILLTPLLNAFWKYSVGCGVKAGIPSWGWGCVLLLSPLWRRMHSALPCTPRHLHLTTHYSAEGPMHNTTARLLPAEEVKYRVTSQHDSKLIWFGIGSTTFYATHILLILPEVQDGIWRKKGFEDLVCTNYRS